MDAWVEAGVANADKAIADSVDVTSLNLTANKKYQQINSELQAKHSELLTLEQEGKINEYRENPTLIGDYLGKLRLKANQLFAFLNVYIDILNELQLEYYTKRQEAFNLVLASDKGSINKAETYARETTQVLGAKIKIVENQINQIRNDYERYNSICMYLQSRLKEFGYEKVMG